MRKLLQYTRTHPFLGGAIFFLIGVLFWGAFNTTLELTNNEAFCISCHEMRDNVYQEYQHSVHYKNRSGVRATCPDCHVPRPWPYMFLRKIMASNELLHHFRGVIDTRELFLARRQALAEHVWRTMAATDSRECRNCHHFAYMDPKDQRQSVAREHSTADAEGKTCIDCHKGIAHRLPESVLDAEHKRFKEQKVPCSRCHEGMARPPEEDWDGKF
jgi:cytochrome c-type protein NapC